MSRRILGLAAILLMANTTFAATVTACTMTGGAERHAPPSANASPSGGHHQHHAVQPTAEASSFSAPSNAPSNDAPQVPTCCKALAPCTSAVAVAAAVTMTTSCGHRASIAAAGEVSPSSLLVAPEPPPPKA